MKIDARLTFDKIRHDQDVNAHLVLSLSAPSTLKETRPAIAIIALIDVSPSMESGRKFEYAKKSVTTLIDHLVPGDYFGLVQFAGAAKVVAPPVKITAALKDDLKRKVGDLKIEGATNIADALLLGLKLANKLDLSADVLTRVILFTDGDANTGPATKPNEIVALMEKNLGLATVSAFGYGPDVRQDFLSDLARKGKANYAFVGNPDEALSAFGKELGGLISTYATDIVIEASPTAGHEIVGVISDVDSEEEEIGNEITVRFPDILGEETRHIVLAVKMGAQKSHGPRAVNVFDVKVSYDSIDMNGHKERKTEEVKAKVQFVKNGEQDEKPLADLDQIVGLAQIVRAQIEAEQYAKKGNYVGAQAVMAAAAGSVQGRGHENLHRLANNVSSRLGSAHAYAGGGGYLASVAAGGTRGVGGANYEVHAAQDLFDNGVQLSTSTQSSTSESFNGSNDLTGGPVNLGIPDGSWHGIIASPGPSLAGPLAGSSAPVPPPFTHLMPIPALGKPADLGVVEKESSKGKKKTTASKRRW